MIFITCLLLSVGVCSGSTQPALLGTVAGAIDVLPVCHEVYKALEHLTHSVYAINKAVRSDDCCGSSPPSQDIIDNVNALGGVAQAAYDLAGDFTATTDSSGQLTGDFSQITSGLHEVACKVDILTQSNYNVAQCRAYRDGNLYLVIGALNDVADAISCLIDAIERVEGPSEFFVDLIVNITSVDRGLRDEHKAACALIKTINEVLKACGPSPTYVGVRDAIANENGEVDDLADTFNS